MKHGASLLFSFILLVVDFLALVLAFVLAYIVRVKIDDRPLLEPLTANEYIGVVIVLLTFWLIIYGLLGLYKSHVFEDRFKEFYLLLVGSFIGILFLIGSEYVLNRAVFPARLVTIYGFIFAFLLTLLFRTMARGIRRLLFRYDIGISNVLLVGTTDITEEMAQLLSRQDLGFRVIGIVGDRRKKFQGIEHSIQYKDFGEASKKIKIDEIHSIVQTELFADEKRNDEILAFAQEHHIAYRFVPGNNHLFVGKLEVDLFENIPTISVHHTALVGWGRIVKRLFDIFAGTILLILASPVLLGVWLSITLFGGGKAVFKQTRMSHFKTKIKLYKFRSHKKQYSGNKTPEEIFKKMGRPELSKKYRENGDYLEDDPRITKIGKFLRKTSLDELPQLINVIRGDLSLVGPRPLVPQEMDKFHRKSVILSVKPGLTGLAVVSGRRNINYDERRKLDMYYSQNWSFWLDIQILLKTVVIVIRKVGAR